MARLCDQINALTCICIQHRRLSPRKFAVTGSSMSTWSVWLVIMVVQVFIVVEMVVMLVIMEVVVVIMLVMVLVYKMLHLVWLEGDCFLIEVVPVECWILQKWAMSEWR